MSLDDFNFKEYMHKIQGTPEGQQRAARAAALMEVAQKYGVEAAMQLKEKFQAEHPKAPKAKTPISAS